jgi:hypothetical protein
MQNVYGFGFASPEDNQKMHHRSTHVDQVFVALAPKASCCIASEEIRHESFFSAALMVSVLQFTAAQTTTAKAQKSSPTMMVIVTPR